MEIAAKRRVKPESIRNVADALVLAGFSPEQYRCAYDDLKRALVDDHAAMLHFLAYCEEHIRSFPLELKLNGLRSLFETRAPAHFKASAAVALLNIACNMTATVWREPPDVQSAFWSDLIAILRMAGAPHFVIGDSHSYLYRRIVPSKTGLLIPIPILCLASSAIGLSNPRSISGAAARLRRLAAALADMPEAAQIPLIFKFGQVDVEFVFNFDRIKRGANKFNIAEFEQFCEQSVKSYMDFLCAHFARYKVIIIGVFPPALSDASWREGYVNAHVVAVESRQSLDEVVAGVRRLQIPSLRERTRLHAYYNSVLRERATRAQFRFFDDLPSFLGPGGVVDSRFIPTHKGADHHLEERATAPTISGLIADCLGSSAQVKHTGR